MHDNNLQPCYIILETYLKQDDSYDLDGEIIFE